MDVTYKLGWRTQVKCVKTGNESMFQGGWHSIDLEDLDRVSLLRCALAGLIDGEIHEVREHFQVGGQRIFDPHQVIEHHPIVVKDSKQLHFTIET